MAAIRDRAPGAWFEVFTTTPAWLFEDSLRDGFAVHPVLTDIGLAQVGPMHEDISLTVRRLDEFLPFDPALVAGLAGQIKQLECGLVVCDIAPLGLAVAKAAGLPSVLIENFTWDWIYADYLDEAPGLKAHSDYLRDMFASAGYHIQTEPAAPGPAAHLRTRPVSRRPRTDAGAIRDRLAIPREARAVLITMGGIPDVYGFLDQLAAQREFYFVVPGAGAGGERRGNVRLFPHRSEFYHPDLVNACDAVVGKAGYSTIAETFQAGVPMGYTLRTRGREATVLGAFIQREMASLEIPEAEFNAGTWLADLPRLMDLPRRPHAGPNGAAQVADFVCRL